MELDDALRKGFRLGDWEIRPIEGLVSGAHGSCHLQPKTMDVLLCLAASDGQVVTRDEIISQVWGAAAVSDEPLTRCIHEIRRALGDHSGEPTYIRTIPKRGYQLLADVAELDAVLLGVTDAADKDSSLFWQVTRQQVLWVGAGYALLAWLFVQLARFVELQAGVEQAPPAWVMPALVIIVLLGFPVAIFYAWVRQVSVDSPIGDNLKSSRYPGLASLLFSRRGVDVVLVTLVISVLAVFALDLVPGRQGDVPVRPDYRVAVLPFDVSYDGASERWLGRGIADDLRARLGAHPGLTTSERDTSNRVSRLGLTAQEAGQELNAHFVLDGLVVRTLSDDRVRIDVRFVDALTGFQLWDESFAQPANQLLDIQSHIVAAIADKLGLESGAARLEWPQIRSSRAYESYLRARDQLDSATDLMSIGKAIVWFQQALDSDQSLAVARNGLCRAYLVEMQLGETDWDWAYSRANQACAEALLQSPDSLAAHLAVGDFYRLTGHPASALDEYSWVADKNPDNPVAWRGMAVALHMQGAGEAAQDAFRQALRLAPGDAESQQAYADFLLQEGRYDAAIEASRHLISLDRERLAGYEILSEALFRAGEFDASIQASRQVLSRDLAHNAAVVNIGRSYYHLGRHQRATEIYRQAQKMLPNDHEVAGGLADAYAQVGHVDAILKSRKYFSLARDLANAAINSDEGDAQAYAGLGYYCAALDEPECARTAAGHALELAPGNPEVNFILALVYAQLSEVDAAALATQKALELGFPQALVLTDPILAAVLPQRRFATLGASEGYGPGFRPR